MKLKRLTGLDVNAPRNPQPRKNPAPKPKAKKQSKKLPPSMRGWIS